MPPEEASSDSLHAERERTPLRQQHPQEIPKLQIGGYICTRGSPTRIRCKGYDGPPDVNGGGIHRRTYEPGTKIGPILKILISDRFYTVQIPGGLWINVWCGNRHPDGVWYAYPCD